MQFLAKAVLLAALAGFMGCYASSTPLVDLGGGEGESQSILSKKIDKLEKLVDKLEEKVDSLEKKVKKLD